MNSPFLQRAQNAGFAKVLGAETSHFLLLDKDTDGTHGRRIYIDGRLATKFNGISDTDIKFVFSKLKQLGALAGGITSLDNLNNAAEHRTIIGSVRLTYKMFQATGTANAKPGVYVTDVDLGSFGQDVPGLYKLQRDKEGWNSNKVKNISTKFAAINGFCKDFEQVGGEIIPPLIKKAYPAGGEIESEGYSLFFNPPSLYSSGRLWRTPQQKRINQKVVQSQLAQVLLDGQKSPQGINWVVHSDGAKLLHQALKEIPGRDLSNHTIMFLSPTQAVSQLISQFKANKINLHKDVMKIQQDDWRSKSAQMFHGRRLAKELGNMPGFEEKAYGFKNQARRDAQGFINSALGAGGLGFGVGSFILAPAAPGVAAVIGAAWGALATFDKIQSWRNIAANSSKDVGLNPHFHSYKTQDEMNFHAKKSAGSVVKTFKDLITGKKG